MAFRGPRLQLALFLAAIFVPCALLIALSIRMIRQEPAISAKQQADERARIVEQAAAGLTSILDRVRAGEVREELEPGRRYRYPETAFVGWTESGKLVLPWEEERDPAARRSRELIEEPLFASAIRECVAVKSQPSGAARLSGCYQAALAAAAQPAQKAYARWMLGQDLAEAGQKERAAALFRALLDEDLGVTDESGIPIRLNAAQSLLGMGGDRKAIAAALDAALSSRPWMPPFSSYAASTISEGLTRLAAGAEERQAAEALQRQAAAIDRLLRQAQSLQDEFPRVASQLKSRPSDAWAAFGDEIWLVGADGDPEAQATIFVERGEDVFRAAPAPQGARFADSREPLGTPLGNRFPGLKLVLGPAVALPSDGGNLQRRFLYFALALVIAATLFAAYLLWRDLRREVVLSDLRAQFVASVTHELKTPLTAIRMYAETLQMGRIGNAETQSEYLGTIVNECERLSRLVEGVLQFSKAEQGKRAWRFKPMQAAEAVRAAARSLEYPLSQHGFRLNMKVQEGLPPISADRDALEQAVLNLLSNAMKYSGEARDIDLALYREVGEIVVRVADRGIGIAPEERERIFEKFYRSPTSENQLIPGTGLGLALVAQTMKAHGGRVTVESAPGKGSAFSLRLPAAPGARNGGNDESDSGD